MASTSTPYGMVGLRRMGSAYNTQGMDANYTIAADYNTTIRFGDLVSLATDGTLVKETGTTGINPIGVFLGCEYTTSELKYRVHSQFFPANTNGQGDPIKAYVLDDPDAYFEIQADGSVAQSALGGNADIVQTATTNQFGKSRNQLATAAIDATASRPLRIVGFVTRPSSAIGDAFTDVIVRINTHALRNTTGTA